MESRGMSYLDNAIRDAHAVVDTVAGTIRYAGNPRVWKLTQPEEQVRAEFWAELIYEYGYSPDRIGVEIAVPDRVLGDRADIVVFKDDRQTIPFAVIECKRDGISDAEFDQAIEQAAGNGTWAKLRADYVMVVAGLTRRVLDFTDRYGILERENNIVADLPQRYGKPEVFKYVKGGPIDLDLMDRSELISVLKKCHQSLWGGGRLSPPAAFGELAKLLFIKMSDESGRLTGEPYEFQIKTHESPAALASRIRTLYEVQRKRDPEVFSDEIRVTDEVLRTIVSHLEPVNLSATDLDVKGVAFETFMDNFFKGDYGQFFTPREVIDFCIKALKPSRTDRVIDPACGSGGFLLHALTYVRNGADDYVAPGTAEHHRIWYDFAARNLYGIEINEEISRIAKMNMILHGDGHTNIARADALQPLPRLRERNQGLAEESFDIVVTNPPFGAQVALSESPYLSQYELATQKSGSRSKTRRTQKTEILYLERIWQLLVPGTGRAAVVLPDGLLTNSSLQYVRDYVLEKFQLLGVVSLPQTTFMHFGTGVKASVVFLRKLAHGESSEDDLVFMGVADSIGYDAVGREAHNDLPELLKQYEEFLRSPSQFEMAL